MSEGTASLLQQLHSWKDGIQSELAFWDTWMRTRGMEWPDDFGRRLDPGTPLALEVAQLLADDVKDAVVIDVGSGPLSRIGQMVDGKRPRIISCDPLMEHYLQLLHAHGLTPLTECLQAPAEDLSAYFDTDFADVVHCSNALDHSFDPVRGLEEMLQVVKPEGAVILLHAANEAVNENYGGFHQWNFDHDDGRFLVWNRTHRIDVNAEFAGIASVTCAKTEDGGNVVAIMRKDGDAAALAARCDGRRRQRIAELHGALMRMVTPDAAPPAQRDVQRPWQKLASLLHRRA